MTVVLFMLPQEIMRFIESQLYTQNPKFRPWAYIRRGLIFGRIFGLVYRRAYLQRVIFGGGLYSEGYLG